MDESVHSAEAKSGTQRRVRRYTLQAVDSARSELLDEVYSGSKKTTKASIRELFPYIVVSRKFGMSWERLAEMMSSQGLPVTPQTLAKYYTEFRADRELPHVKRLIKQIEKNKETFDIRRSLLGSGVDIAARAEVALRRASEAVEAPVKHNEGSAPAELNFPNQGALLPKLLADAVTLEKRGHRIPEVGCSLVLRGKYVYLAETGEPFMGPIPSQQCRLLEQFGKLP